MRRSRSRSLIEPVFDGAGDRPATLAWCAELLQCIAPGRRSAACRSATRRGERRRASERPILLDQRLRRPSRSCRRKRGCTCSSRPRARPAASTARVRVAAVPLGELSAAKERGADRRRTRTRRRGSNSVVRRYREQPPLVRDAAGQWRTGRLDLCWAASSTCCRRRCRLSRRHQRAAVIHQ